MTRGTILLAESSEKLRWLMRLVLRGSGYRVLEAADGLDALKIATQYAGHIDLLVTEVEMPCLDGPALSRRLRRARPGLRVLCVTGTGGKAPVAGAACLAKPFTILNLLHTTDRLLDVSRRPGEFYVANPDSSRPIHAGN